MAKRRLTYAVMGISEIVLSSTMAGQYLLGGVTGIKDSVLLIGPAVLGMFAGMRAFFL